MFLPQDAEMQLEKFYIHTPKDHMIFRKLSESDKVELTKENTANGNDPVLNKAVEYLTSKS
jgi:hypothetical protein